MNAAELLVKCLSNEGVTTVFGIPGEETLAVTDALVDSGIRFITCRQEQGAAFMADVWGRLTGRAGVCLTTLGPGATNLATGLADANLDRSPVVAVTGQAGRDRIHKESHQYVDIVDVFRPITKWNMRVEVAAVVLEAMRKAFKVVEAEKPGACHGAEGGVRGPRPVRGRRAGRLLGEPRADRASGTTRVSGVSAGPMRTGSTWIRQSLGSSCRPDECEQEGALGERLPLVLDRRLEHDHLTGRDLDLATRCAKRQPRPESTCTASAPLAWCSWSLAPSFSTVRTTRSVGSLVKVIALRFPVRQVSSRLRRSISASRRM